MVKSDESGMLGSDGSRHIGTDFSFRDFAMFVNGDCARHVDEVTHTHRVRVVGGGGFDRGQNEPEFCYSLFD